MKKKIKIFIAIAMVASVVLGILFFIFVNSISINGYWEKIDKPGEIWHFNNGVIYIYRDGTKSGNTGSYEWISENMIKITFGKLYENYSVEHSYSSLKLTVLEYMYVASLLEPNQNQSYEAPYYEYKRVYWI